MAPLHKIKKSEIVDHANSLIEMYKAGFLDAHIPRPRTKADFTQLNKKYKKAFMKRFEKKITKEMKKNAPVSIPKRKV